MKQRDLFIILILLLLCLNFRLINFVGIGTNDDIAYIQDARNLASGHNPLASGFNQLGFRLGMVAPLTLLYKAFGYNELGFSLYPLICSLITCVLIYLTAVRLWGRGAAIFACLLWIAYPLQLVFDTQLSPSNQQATCVAAVLLLYFYATTGKTSSSISRFNYLSKLREPVLLILCGVFFGLAWWVNEIFVTFIIVVIPFLFLVRPKIKHLSWIIAGFLFIIFLELLIVKISCGSWLARFDSILRTEAVVKSETSYGYLPRTLFKIWNTIPLHDEGHFGIIWYLFIVVTILALLLKKKVSLALALGCWLWLAYFQWGVQSPEGAPIARYIRYISMIVPIQCLVFGAILGHLIKFSKKLKPVLIFLFVLLLIHLSWLGTKAVNTAKIHTEDFKEITKFLMNLRDGDVIYTDTLTRNFIELYSKNSLRIRIVNYFPEPYPPEKGILVKDGSWYTILLPEYRERMPAWSLSPPAHWPLIHTVRGKKVETYGEFDPKIYRILPQNSKGEQK